MLINSSAFSPNDDDANYDENDAVWQEEEKNELDEFGFKAEGEEEEEETEEEATKTTEEDEDEEDDDEDEEENEEGFGLEKDV